MQLSTAQYKKKLHGWLSYAFASEVFVIVSLTLFLPICLEQFARDNGFLMPDRTEPCSSLKPAPTTGVASDLEQARCVVKIGWAWIDSASFSLYIYSISVALQAITVISMGGIADNPPHRKRLLLGFAALGSLAATVFLFLPSTSPIWYLSALLAMLANIGFGASVVAMNAYIPSLAQEAPEVIHILAQIQSAEDTPSPDADHDPDTSIENPSVPLLAGSATYQVVTKKKLQVQYQTELSRATSRISSLGIALGYGAGICLLIVALIPITKLQGSTFALRLAIGLSGIWWAVFSIPAAIWLPGASSPHRLTARSDDGVLERGLEVADKKELNIRREIMAAWIRLGTMLRWSEMKKLRNTFKYLAAWFLLSDGFTTITSTAILFGKTTLHMSPSALILVGVLTPTSGILGSLAWPILQRRFAWTNLQVLVGLVIMASMIPAYGCLGFLVQGRARFGGLTTQGEMFGLAVYFGSVYGAFQGYARAFYAELLPPGEEARWYGLFSITDKSSSFIGPLVVGLISDFTGNIRYAFFFLVFMIWLAVPLLMSVDVERGRKDAQEYEYLGHTAGTNTNGVHI
ncbi:autophagy-related protein 22-like protein [Crassisporium funariophilum]|nr:autophagy-related protein 22-like protein [Crassisporium funariophilum]